VLADRELAMARFRAGFVFGAIGLLVCALFMGLFWLSERAPPPLDELLGIPILLRMVLWPASLIFLVLDGSPNWGPLFWRVCAIAAGLNFAMYFVLGVLFGPRWLDRRTART
jgi:hypothetical protein